MRTKYPRLFRVFLFVLALAALNLWRFGTQQVYLVDSYAALEKALSHTERVYLPEESLFPAYDEADFFVRAYTTSRLSSQKDGYHMTLGNDYLYSVLCMTLEDPTYTHNLPLRADLTYQGTAVQTDQEQDRVALSFLLDGFLYRVELERTDAGPALPDDALDTLFKIADNILQQAS